MLTNAFVAMAWRATFVSASLTTKYAALSTAGGGRSATSTSRVDRDRRAGDDRRQRGVEAAVLEDHRVDAADEVADLPQRRLRLLVGDGHHRASLLDVVVVELLARCPEVGGQRDEALLGAVVQVALDAPPLGLGAVDGRRAARLQLGHLGGVLLVGARPEQGRGRGQLAAAAMPIGDPRGDEHEPDDARRREPARRPAARA